MESPRLLLQHLTRELVWHPATLEHPNGATGLNEVTLADPSAKAWEILAFMAELDPTPRLTLEKRPSAPVRPDSLSEPIVRPRRPWGECQ